MWIYVSNYEVQTKSLKQRLLLPMAAQKSGYKSPDLVHCWRVEHASQNRFINWYVCKRERVSVTSLFILCVCSTVSNLLYSCSTERYSRCTKIGKARIQSVQIYIQSWYSRYRHMYSWGTVGTFGTVGTDTALLSSPKC